MKLKIKDFALKGDLICVKEFAYGSPKFLTGTFLNANIMWLRPNSRFCSQEVKNGRDC